MEGKKRDMGGNREWNKEQGKEGGGRKGSKVVLKSGHSVMSK